MKAMANGMGQTGQAGFHAIALIANIFAAVGDHTRIGTSPTGLSWTERNSGTSHTCLG